MEIIGDKWSLLLIRDAIILGKTSFNEFRYSKEKIASNILAKRLETLVAYGIFEKKQNAEKKSKYDYILTDLGKSLTPVVVEIGKWGYQHIDNVNDSIAYFKENKELD